MKKNKNTKSIFRGGSWVNFITSYLRGAYRFRYNVINRFNGGGFRLVLINASNENKNGKE